MAYTSPDGDKFVLGRPFEYNDRRYSAGSATAETFESLGFTVTVNNPPTGDFDPQFYFWYPGAEAAEARPVDTVKAELIRAAKSEANGILRGTDWAVLKGLDSFDTAVSTALSEYRAAVRAATGTYETAVNGCADVDALAALDAPAWPEVSETVKSYTF